MCPLPESNQEAAKIKKPLTLAEVKTLVFDKWTKSMDKLNLDQKRLIVYLSKFTKVEDAQKAREIVNELINKYNLSEEHAVMLVNILPEKEDEIKAYLYKDYPLLTQADYKEMLNLLRALKE